MVSFNVGARLVLRAGAREYLRAEWVGIDAEEPPLGSKPPVVEIHRVLKSSAHVC